MPRNASGTYTLPLPPVEPNTVIESDWANDTLADIAAALDDSLSRSGQGGMTAPFRIVDGSAAAPSLSFIAEPSSGLFRQASGVVGMSIQGVAKQTWNANGTTIAGDITLQGAVALPSVVTVPTAGLTFTGGSIGIGMAPVTQPTTTTTLDLGHATQSWVNLYVAGVRKAFFSATGNSTAIGTHDAFPLYFLTGNVGRQIIAADGNVVFGTGGTTTNFGAGYLSVAFNASTYTTLDLKVGDVRQASFGANVTQAVLGTNTNIPLLFITNGTEAARISALGDFGLGMVPVDFGAGVTNLAIGSTLNSLVDLTVGGMRMASFSSQTAQTVIGTIANFPLALWTNSLERMVIAANGKVGIGGAAAAHGLTVTWTTAGNGIAAVNLASDVSSSFLSQRADNAGATMTMRLNVTVAGSISHPTLTTTAYNTSSDARLKRNIRPVKDVGRIIDNIPVVSFDWKADGIHVPVGLIAQDVHGVFPQAVHEGSSDVNEDPWMLDHSKMVPLLLKEIQSLRERVNALEH